MRQSNDSSRSTVASASLWMPVLNALLAGRLIGPPGQQVFPCVGNAKRLVIHTLRFCNFKALFGFCWQQHIRVQYLCVVINASTQSLEAFF